MADDTPGSELDRLRRAADGDDQSWRLLLDEHHGRLRRMVELRLDPRLQGRLDPSDVLQEAYVDAAGRLGEYVGDPRLPFYLWLRQVVSDRLLRLYRHHVGIQKRDPGREVDLAARGIAGASSAVLAAALVSPGDRPSEAAMRAELRQRLEAVLEQMDPLDREVLALRHFEQLGRAESARVLGLTEAAAGKRYVRALSRLRHLLGETPGGLEGWRP
jgi:RNA polymerase sigma-70 factor (ECF subfamily)